LQILGSWQWPPVAGAEGRRACSAAASSSDIALLIGYSLTTSIVYCFGARHVWGCGFVCLSVILTGLIFFSKDQNVPDRPLYCPLHCWPWKVKGKSQGHKNRENAEIVLGGNSALNDPI